MPPDETNTIRAGADGYLLKDMEPEQLLDRIRASLAGETVIGETLAARLAGALRQEAQDSASGMRRDLALLTEREQQVLRCLADGQSNTRIARAKRRSDPDDVSLRHKPRQADNRSWGQG